MNDFNASNRIIRATIHDQINMRVVADIMINITTTEMEIEIKIETEAEKEKENEIGTEIEIKTEVEIEKEEHFLVHDHDQDHDQDQDQGHVQDQDLRDDVTLVYDHIQDLIHVVEDTRGEINVIMYVNFLILVCARINK